MAHEHAYLICENKCLVESKPVSETEKNTWNGKYDKPSGGIPASDLAVTIPAITPLTCTLPVAGWTDNEITVACTGVTAISNVIVSPAPASYEEYASCGIRCISQGADTLKFKRTKANTNALTVNVMNMA